MIYLLDTCTISELVKKSPQPGVVDWLAAADEERLYLSVLTLGEIRKGIVKAPDSKRRDKLQDWLDWDLQQRFDGRILPLSSEIALRWGEIQGEAQNTGRSMPVIDSLIAATGLVHGATIVTRNGDDMAWSGVQIFDPWRLGGAASWQIHEPPAKGYRDP